ncbi:hypothetical protein ACWD0E_17020, partial [Streptomyces sp. NPDC003002]
DDMAGVWAAMRAQDPQDAVPDSVELARFRLFRAPQAPRTAGGCQGPLEPTGKPPWPGKDQGGFP